MIYTVFPNDKDGEMLYYGILPSVRREFDKIFEKYGLYYGFGHHWKFSCYYI